MAVNLFLVAGDFYVGCALHRIPPDLLFFLFSPLQFFVSTPLVSRRVQGGRRGRGNLRRTCPHQKPCRLRLEGCRGCGLWILGEGSGARRGGASHYHSHYCVRRVYSFSCEYPALANHGGRGVRGVGARTLFLDERAGRARGPRSEDCRRRLPSKYFPQHFGQQLRFCSGGSGTALSPIRRQLPSPGSRVNKLRGWRF